MESYFKGFAVGIESKFTHLTWHLHSFQRTCKFAFNFFYKLFVFYLVLSFTEFIIFFLYDKDDWRPLTLHHLAEFLVRRWSRTMGRGIRIHPRWGNVVRSCEESIAKRVLTVIWSGSCHKCHRIHHHMSPPTTSAVTRTAFECGGGAVRYETLEIERKRMRCYFWKYLC